MECFHFNSAFVARLDPEFPGDGDWGCEVFHFDRNGAVVEELRSPWGTPLVVEITPESDARWIATLEAGGLGGLTGLYATPSDSHLCALADGLAYLINAGSPADGAMPVHHQVSQVVSVDGCDLLLLVRFIDIVALGPDGVAWRSHRLAVDGLAVVGISSEAIVCSVDNLGGSETITLDPSTGEQLSGTRLDSFWPPGAM